MIERTQIEELGTKEQLDLYKHATQYAEVGVWQFDLETGDVFWDSTMYNLYQVEKDEYENLFHAWMARLNSKDFKKLESELKEVIKSGGEYKTTYEITLPSGETRYIRATAKAVQNDDNWTIKLLGTNWDVTETVIGNRKVEKILNHTRAFIDNSPSAMALLDLDMCYLAASKQWYKDYDISDSDIIGKSHYEVLPDIPEERKKIHARVLKGDFHQDQNAIFERRNGKTQWLSTELRPWYLDDQTIGGLIIYSIDVTESHLAHKRLKISEEEFKGAFNNSSIGMALVSLNGGWMKVNPQLCEIVGYPEQELLNLTFQDITHPNDLQTDLTYLDQLVKGEISSYRMEKRYFHKNGELVWVLLSVSLVRNDDGSPSHFVSIIEDITTRKKTEEELKSTMTELRESLKIVNEQNQRLTNFAHIVSHNLRSHSGNFNMLLQLLNEETNPEERIQIERLLSRAADKLMDTIHNLNEITSIQLNSKPTIKETCLFDVIEKTLVVVQADLLSKSIKLENKVNPEICFPYVQSYLESIVQNLLTNAIKYRDPEKDCFITLRTKEMEDYVIFEVEDNGLGIDLKRYQPKVFGMYKTFHGNQDSRGIGLFLTKNQVESLGGKIQVESEPKKGSIFRVYFRKKLG